MGGLTNELKCLAWSNMFIGIGTAIDAGGGFALQLYYPARVGPHAAFPDQGQRVGPALPLPGRLGHAVRSGREGVDHPQRGHACGSIWNCGKASSNDVIGLQHDQINVGHNEEFS